MIRPNPDAYTPATEETTRLRKKDAVPMAGDDDYEIGRLSPERCVPVIHKRPGMPANYTTRWRGDREAERQIDELIEKAEQARKAPRPPRPEGTSGGVPAPPLTADNPDQPLWF